MRTPEGRQYGPVDRAVLDQWVGEGRVSAECQLNGKGGPAWQPAARVYPVLNETEASSHSPVLDKSPPRRGVRRGRLILGLALAGCVFPPLSLWAAVIGTRDLRRMQLGSLHARDENLTRAGQIIATVASMIWTGVFAVGLFLLLLSAVRSV